MIVQAKKVWEQLRRGDISRDEQKNLMAKMMNIIGGKVQDVNDWFVCFCYLNVKLMYANLLFLGYFQAWCFSYDSNMSQEG